MHLPSISYRPIENIRINASAEFKYHDSGPYQTYINRHYRSLYSVLRENILTEEDNGIKFDLGFSRRQHDQKFKKQTSYGAWRINSSLKKTINPNISISLYSLLMKNDLNKKGKESNNSWKYGIDLIPSVSIKITDKLSYFWNTDLVIYRAKNQNLDNRWAFIYDMTVGYFNYRFNDLYSAYLQVKYLNYTGPGKNEESIYSNAAQKYDSFSYYIGQTMNLTNTVSFTTELGSTLFKSKDYRDFFATEAKYPSISFYLNIKLK